MLLFYIRHGEPIYNPDSLTLQGEKQAAALSKRLALYGIDEIYASSSARAISTAKPTAELLKKPVTILDWCNEHYAWHELTVHNADGKPENWLYIDKESRLKFVSPEISALGNKWYNHEYFSAPRYKSGMQRIESNTYEFLKNLGYVHNDTKKCYTAVNPNEKRVALFAHEGFGLAFLSAVLDVPYPMFCTRFALQHSSMTVISFDGEKNVVPCVLQLSNDSHLYKENIITGYNGDIKF